MLDLIFRIGFRRGLIKKGTSVKLPSKPSLFGTITPATNLIPAKTVKYRTDPAKPITPIPKKKDVVSIKPAN